MAAPLKAPTPDIAKAARDDVMSDAKANRKNSGSAHPSQASATTPEARVALAEPPDAVTWPSALHVLAYQRDVLERTSASLRLAMLAGMTVSIRRSRR